MTKLVTFEDLAEGAVFWGEQVVADLGEMVDYARRYDPWPFHVDVEAAKQTPFGGLVASAGYTFSLWCQSVHTIIRTPGAVFMKQDAVPVFSVELGFIIATRPQA